MSLAGGGMELSWRYAWAAFIMTTLLHRPFPLPEAIATFALAAVLTSVAQGRGWRVILILWLHVFGFLIAASRIVYVLNDWSYPFLSQRWLVEFLSRPRSFLEWFILAVILFFALLFWVGGVTLARRSRAYLTICTRFDLGVAAFFCLSLIKLLLLAKGNIRVRDPMAELLLFPFFVFSLLAIGIARNQSSAQRDFLSGYQGMGVIVSFTVVVLLFTTGLVLLFLPYLRAVAEMGYGVLKSAAGPLEPILVTILRFLFFHGRSRPETVYSSFERDETALVSSAESSWWTELIEKIFGWGFLGLGGLIALIICGVGLWYLFRWLFSKTSISENKRVQWCLILLWAAKLRAVLFLFWGKIVRKVKGYRDAAQLYNALLGWGLHSGLPHFLSETPTEYGLRLRHRFSPLNREVEVIIEAFNQEVYGETVLDERQLAVARLAWRRLRSPLQWPCRLKSWFIRPVKL